jgi:hypothetical protein
VLDTIRRRIREGRILNRLVMLGETQLRRTLVAFTEHYHGERNHQGLQDRLIVPRLSRRMVPSVVAHDSVAFSTYYRAA